MGDHGYDPNTDNEYATIECRSNPLLMAKSADEHHELTWNDAPVSYDDLQGAYQNLLDGSSGENAFDGLTEDNNRRRFLLFKWSEENVMTEWYQNGTANDMSQMKPSGKEYKYTGNHLKQNLEGH